MAHRALAAAKPVNISRRDHAVITCRPEREKKRESVMVDGAKLLSETAAHSTQCVMASLYALWRMLYMSDTPCLPLG